MRKDSLMRSGLVNPYVLRFLTSEHGMPALVGTVGRNGLERITLKLRRCQLGKNSYYFSHDCNARNDNKLIQLRMKHGMRGYGIYFGIIELLMEANSYQLPMNFEAIAYDLREDAKDIEDVVTKFELFNLNCTQFWSDSLKERMKKREELSQRRAEAGKKGGQKKQERKPPSENPEFEKVWVQYPLVRRVGKKKALTYWQASVKTDKDRLDIVTALNNYKVSPEVGRNYIQNASTWFNNWKDWLVINTAVDNDGVGAEWKTKSSPRK